MADHVQTVFFSPQTTPLELADAIRKCINTPSIQAKAKEVAEQMEKEDATARLVELIKDYMESHIRTGKHMKVVEELQQKLGGRDFFRSCDSLFYFQLGDDGCLPVLWHGNEGSLGSNQYHVNEKHCDNSENSSNLCQHLDNGVSMAMVVSQNGWFTMEKSHSKLDELGVPPMDWKLPYRLQKLRALD